MPAEVDADLEFLPSVCAGCGCELAPSLLACPSCRRLVHAERLKSLANSAEAARAAGDSQAALVLWREALALLPEEARQFTAVSQKIAELGREIDAHPGQKSAGAGVDEHAEWHWWSGNGVKAGALGGIALAAWKLKFVIVALLAKGKFLLLGLTKASTFLSMFASMGVFWNHYGGWFALGIVLSIYVHEMGHVAALARYGVKADAPMFVPGLGAFVRYRQWIADPHQQAWVSLSGPLWGFSAALAALGLYAASGSPLWGAVAYFGALINLLNLIPISILDGSGAFLGMTRPQRWLAAAAAATAWSVTANPLLIVLMGGCAFRAATERSQPAPERSTVSWYIGIVAVLTLILLLPLPKP